MSGGKWVFITDEQVKALANCACHSLCEIMEESGLYCSDDAACWHTANGCENTRKIHDTMVDALDSVFSSSEAIECSKSSMDEICRRLDSFGVVAKQMLRIEHEAMSAGSPENSHEDAIMNILNIINEGRS